MHVEGILDAPRGGSPFGEVSISKATFDSSFANHDNQLTLTKSIVTALLQYE